MITTRNHAVTVALGLCAAAALAVAFWDLTAGGFHFRVLGVRISSWEAYKPFRIGMLALVAAVWLHDHDAPESVAFWHRLHYAAPFIAGAAAIASVAVGVRFGIRAAGGADAYGYVSQAYAWASGALRIPNPLTSVTAAIGPAVAPLGYELAADPAWLVPIYAPGLPLMMTVALKMTGPTAVYWVVPLLGGATVWLTYLLGRRAADARTGLFAALLVASSPIFVFQSLEPMSDVPVTACWMAAWVLALWRGSRAPLASGLAAGIAILTRPNLLPLTLIPAWVAIDRQWRRAALFATGFVPWCLLVAAVNHRLYGSALQSGYGPIAALYAWDRFGENLLRYSLWLVDLHFPGILLGLVAPFLVRVQSAVAMVAFAAMVMLSYLFYVVFDSWPFARFLLPAIPLVCVLASAVLLEGVRRLPMAVRGAIVLLVCALIPLRQLLRADELAVFAIGRAEHRYVAVGEAVGRRLEPNAVLLTVLQSGSVRMYGRRATVRWDRIEPPALDAVIDTLRKGRYEPYILVEEWEEGPFRERFGAFSEVGRLDWPATLEYDGVSATRIYSVAARARHKAGDCVVTRGIPSATRPE